MRSKSVIVLVLIALTAVGLSTHAGAQGSDGKMITQTPKMKMTTAIPEKITTPDKVNTPSAPWNSSTACRRRLPSRGSTTTSTGPGPSKCLSI